MPCTRENLEGDLADCYQRLPPAARFPYGHTHLRQEEVYVVVRGSGRMKVGAELVELVE